MFRIIHGNRLEGLAERLLADPARYDTDVLEPETIIVPSLGMARWLKDRIALHDGVCANVHCSYLAEFLWRSFSALLPDVPARSPFDPEVIAWYVFERLGALPEVPEYGPLAAYVTHGDPQSRMGLASRIARLLDQYLVYRPDWLRAWETGRLLGLGSGDTERWQARLWRELAGLSPSALLDHPKDRYLAALAGLLHKDLRAWLPPRIALFAIPRLPPLYFEILLALSAHIDVHYYLLNPCREYWADIVAERDLARLSLAGEAGVAHHEIGHPLLAAWGRQPQEHLNLVAAMCGEEGVEQEEHFEDPAGLSLLARLQRSVLDLDDTDRKGLVLSPHEHSVQVHVCHSLIRELQVLHDQLLSLFDADPELGPADIVVMTPDLEGAAPHIDSVFGSAPREGYIPFGITGRASPSATPLLRAYATLLGLPRSRFEASIVMELIETPAVARRFDLGESDLACIRAWLRESGVRWARDATHRALLGLPAETRHTWADGLARLLLGYALPGSGRRTFAGVLPYDDIEGSPALALGKLCTVFEALEGAARDLAIPRPPAEWVALLIAYTDRFLLPTEDEQGDAKRIRYVLTALGEDATLAAAYSPVGVEVIAALFTERLMGTAPGASPTGAVTFCGIGSLRGIPFRVVCLIGLADTAFPRQAAVQEFDLMPERPRLGDRARHHDDRAAFLDALLCAREVLYLSYPGRNVRDDSSLPPAIPVSELLDYLGRSVAGGADAVRRRLITEHRLQSWSPHYFRGLSGGGLSGETGALFSYATDYAEVARRAATDSRSAGRPLFLHPLPEPGAEWRQVEIDRLIEFFSHPVRFLLRERLGIHLGAGEAELPDEEPFRLGRQDGFRLAERLLPLCLAGAGNTGIEEIALAGSELPHGAPGRIELRNEWRGLARFRADLIRLGPTHPLDALPFTLVIGEVSLTGSLSGLHPDGLFAHRLGTRGVFTLWNAWLRHLCLCAMSPAGVAARSRWLLKDVLLEFTPVEDAGAELGTLLGQYRRGLSTPLPYAPRSALALLEGSAAKVRSIWAGSPPRHPGENHDPWFRLLYGSARDDLPEGFETTAHALLDPLFAHVRETPAFDAAGDP
ncbi:MAG: exodeoxyribonuclease V subunit gamma [Gammaproteobacteria bacterium]